MLDDVLCVHIYMGIPPENPIFIVAAKEMQLTSRSLTLKMTTLLLFQTLLQALPQKMSASD
jgi:hypothetical protein